MINKNEVKIKLHAEELDLSKQHVQLGEVKIHKEIFKEEKIITVPVTREELVIEKIKSKSSETEIIRIPISEEHVEIIKHPVMLEDISIYQSKFQDIMHIDEILKHEEIQIKTTGNVNVIESKQKNT